MINRLTDYYVGTHSDFDERNRRSITNELEEMQLVNVAVNLNDEMNAPSNVVCFLLFLFDIKIEEFINLMRTIHI